MKDENDQWASWLLYFFRSIATAANRVKKLSLLSKEYSDIKSQKIRSKIRNNEGTESLFT